MTMYQKIAALLASCLIVFLFACGPSPQAKLTPEEAVRYDNQIAEADALYAQGCYSCLKEAFSIYENWTHHPAAQKRDKTQFIKTALLLALRENELAILNTPFIDRAEEVIQNNKELQAFSIYADIVRSIRISTKGTAADVYSEGGEEDYFDTVRERAARHYAVLQQNITADVFNAVLYITFNQDNFYFLDKEKDYVEAEFKQLRDHFADSPLVRYYTLIFLKDSREPEKMEAFLTDFPDFKEMHYYLAEAAMERRRLVEAEKHYLTFYEEFPASTSALISLASIYLALEEYQESIDFYDKCLDFIPNYRDALLGKAIGLSWTGEHERALSVLNRLIELGMYLMGESYYWLAWNQNELERFDSAWENIEKTKNYIIGDARVYSLAGMIAFNRSQMETAEENFLEALKLDPMDCGSCFYLGTVYSLKEMRETSGEYYTRAAGCYLKKEQSWEKRIQEIETSAFSENRKRIHIQKTKKRITKTREMRASALMNAAGSFYSAGMESEALQAAEKAMFHPDFRVEAEGLIQKIKERKEYNRGKITVSITRMPGGRILD